MDALQRASEGRQDGVREPGPATAGARYCCDVEYAILAVSLTQRSAGLNCYNFLQLQSRSLAEQHDGN